MRRLGHDHIVLTYGILFGRPPGSERDSFMLLLEQCDFDLGVLVHSSDKLDWARTGPEEGPRLYLQIAQQMSSGLAYIQHSDAVRELLKEHVAHLDLKPGNVLIKTDQKGRHVAKIADFGVSGESEDAWPFGTHEYMAPECFKEKFGRPGKPSDVFSFAIILWEMFARRRVYTAFPGVDEIVDKKHLEETGERRVDVSLVAARMASGDQRPELEGTRCPEVLALLMQSCWVIPPPASPGSDLAQRHRVAMSLRPTFMQIEAILAQMARTPDWAARPEPQPEPALEEVNEQTFDSWLDSIGLTEKRDGIFAYCSSGTELQDLRSMDEEELAEMLGDADIGLDEQERQRLGEAVRALAEPEPAAEEGEPPATDSAAEASAAPPTNAKWSELLERLGKQHAQHLRTAGRWLAEEDLRATAEEQSKEIARLRAELDALRSG